MTRHVDAEALGRFSEGDLSQRRAARVGAHLSECGRCSDLGKQLAGVTALLASTGVPPMPEHLTARISSALAAESALRAAREPAAASGAAAGTEDSVPVTSVPGTGPGRAGRDRSAAGRSRPSHAARPGRRLRLPRLTAPVAARVLVATGVLVLIGGGTYAIVRQGPSGPVAASRGSSGPAKTPPGSQRPLAGSGAAGPAREMTFGPALHYTEHGKQHGFVPVLTASNFLPGQLTAQVGSTLNQVNPVQKSFGTGSPTSSRPQPSAVPGHPARFGGILVDVIEGCVSRIAAGRQVILVDIARYLGKPATIIVTAASAPAAAELLWVVGPACSATASDVLAQRLLPSG